MLFTDQKQGVFAIGVGRKGDGSFKVSSFDTNVIAGAKNLFNGKVLMRVNQRHFLGRETGRKHDPLTLDKIAIGQAKIAQDASLCREHHIEAS